MPRTRVKPYPLWMLSEAVRKTVCNDGRGNVSVLSAWISSFSPIKCHLFSSSFHGIKHSGQKRKLTLKVSQSSVNLCKL